MTLFIGTAGWNIPARYADQFAPAGSHLERYGSRLKAAEINSSFYQPHQKKTYARWASSVPADFRFSVKLPRSVTHAHRLKDNSDLLARFLEDVGGLDSKLGVVLVQLPPSLAYEAGDAAALFTALHDRSGASIACEPRHASWFTHEADAALRALRVARVAADPPRGPGDGMPGGWPGLRYWRLHGSPKLYYSDYGEDALRATAHRLRDGDWCIFDNTAAFAALGDALDVMAIAAT